MYSDAKDTSMYSVLNSVTFEKVLRNNVDESTFGNPITNMEKTIQEPNRAFFQIVSEVLNSEAYKCKVI